MFLEDGEDGRIFLWMTVTPTQFKYLDARVSNYLHIICSMPEILTGSQIGGFGYRAGEQCEIVGRWPVNRWTLRSGETADPFFDLPEPT
jgi:hypothetical protein